jgi:hypothetical protein
MASSIRESERARGVDQRGVGAARRDVVGVGQQVAGHPGVEGHRADGGELGSARRRVARRRQRLEHRLDALDSRLRLRRVAGTEPGQRCPYPGDPCIRDGVLVLQLPVNRRRPACGDVSGGEVALVVQASRQASDLLAQIRQRLDLTELVRRTVRRRHPYRTEGQAHRGRYRDQRYQPRGHAQVKESRHT